MAQNWMEQEKGAKKGEINVVAKIEYYGKQTNTQTSAILVN